MAYACPPSLVQFSPLALPPGQAPQTPRRMAYELCMIHPTRIQAQGLPPVPAPAKSPAQAASPAPGASTVPDVHAQPTVSELRAKQEAGGLPPSCRGGHCTGDQFLKSIDKHFRVLYRDLKGTEKLAGKSLLILLPEQDPGMIVQAQRLLAQHADFSGKNGRVLMNAQASRWLANPKGIVPLESGHASRHAEILTMIDLEIRELAELVQRNDLGAPPQFKGASLAQMQLQFIEWLNKAGQDMEIFGALNQHGQKLKQLYERAPDSLLPNAIANEARIRDFNVAVVAGPDAAVDLSDPSLEFPGLIITPAQPATMPARWIVGELASSLHQQHRIGVTLIDMQRKAIAPTRSLDGVLVVAGVRGDAVQSAELASRLLEVLRQSPSGEVPVQVLRMSETLALSGKGQTYRVLDDPHFPAKDKHDQRFQQALDALVQFISSHPVQEPLEWESVQTMGHKAFTVIATARVESMGSLRAQGLKLLKEYEARYDDVTQWYASRWRSLFAQALEAVQQSGEGRGMHLLALPMELARSALATLRDTPDLVKAFGQAIMVMKVEEVPIRVALVPDVKLM